MKTAVVSFFYPAVVDYLNSLKHALNGQTWKDFTLLIFNDGLNQMDLDDFTEGLESDYLVIEAQGTPAEIRYEALDYLKNSDFDALIFQDSDDSLSQNRVETVCGLLESYDIVVNDLNIIGPSGETLLEGYWKKRIEGLQKFTFEHLIPYNFAGFTNTSIRRSLLDSSQYRTDHELIAVDWWVFFKLMRDSNVSGVFTSDTFSEYRQHGNNIIGIQSDSERISKIRSKHFEALKDTEGELEMEDLLNSAKYFSGASHDNLFWWELN